VPRHTVFEHRWQKECGAPEDEHSAMSLDGIVLNMWLQMARVSFWLWEATKNQPFWHK
jgi:hypothetical protein